MKYRSKKRNDMLKALLNHEKDAYLSVKEVSELLRTPLQNVYSYISSGVLPAVKLDEELVCSLSEAVSYERVTTALLLPESKERLSEKLKGFSGSLFETIKAAGIGQNTYYKIVGHSDMGVSLDCLRRVAAVVGLDPDDLMVRVHVRVWVCKRDDVDAYRLSRGVCVISRDLQKLMEDSFREKHLTIAELSEVSGISVPSVYRFLLTPHA